MNERKRAVLLTAQRLFIKKGFAATSIQDILNEAQISKGTFYNYFPSKNECLIAILERANEEATIRRRELQVGQELSNKTILAKQIAVRMQVSREYKLLPLFEAIFHSEDEYLRSFGKKHHFAELSWLTNRLIDVYGKEFKPYAQDGSVLMLGMLQHVFHVWTLHSQEEIPIDELLDYIIRRMDSIVPTLVKTQDKLLTYPFTFQKSEVKSDHSDSKAHVLDLLITFSNDLEGKLRPKSNQFITFMIDELRSDEPRSFILQTVTHSFLKLFRGSAHEMEARDVASRLLSFIDSTNITR